MYKDKEDINLCMGVCVLYTHIHVYHIYIYIYTHMHTVVRIVYICMFVCVGVHVSEAASRTA